MNDTNTTQNTNEPQVQQKDNSKEYNFRALEQKYNRQIEQERAARLEAERRAQEYEKAHQQSMLRDDDEDSDDEPYVSKKKLKKQLDAYDRTKSSDIDKKMEYVKQQAKEELKQELWMEQHSDFYEVLDENNVSKLQQRSPKLAEIMARLPDNFDRQKLVYQSIKELGIDKPQENKPSIQDTINQKQRGGYYQPSGVSTGGYDLGSGDFSPAGQKKAYENMMKLKSKLQR